MTCQVTTNVLQKSYTMIESSNTFLKLAYEILKNLNPPQQWPGGLYQPPGAMGVPIGPPKQRYIPLQSPDFP